MKKSEIVDGLVEKYLDLYPKKKFTEETLFKFGEEVANGVRKQALEEVLIYFVNTLRLNKFSEPFIDSFKETFKEEFWGEDLSQRDSKEVEK